MTFRLGAKRRSPEDQLHIAVADFLTRALPVNSFWTTIPTGNLSMTQAQRMKRKGYFAGTPDIAIVYRGNSYWIELKAPDGRVSPEQRWAVQRLGEAGACVGLAKSLADVQMWLEQWGIPLRASLEPRAVNAARLA